ncbi:hypothetical protein CPB86DRAFT_829878 [Serendipita vermifera]|nr:hypothetical protein CPB86DRAFT_829878 [Serendipita vermifera]
MENSATDQEMGSVTAVAKDSSQTEESDGAVKVEKPLSEWKSTVDESAFRQIKPDSQSESHISYAYSLLKRWSLYHYRKDLDRAIVYLEKALYRLPYTPSQARYGVVTSLAEAHYARFNKFNAYDEDMVQAIRYWEDAYGLSIVLRRKGNTDNDLLIKLAKAYVQSCEEGVYGPEALHQAVDYYQLALVRIPPDYRGAIYLELGRAYQELYYHDLDRNTAQLSLDNFDAALKCLVGSERWIDAANGKTHVLFVLKMDAEHDESDEEQEMLEWVGSVLKEISNDPVSLAVYGILAQFYDNNYKLDSLFDLSNLALWFSRSSMGRVPPMVHIMVSSAVYAELQEDDATLPPLRTLVDALNHLERFFERADWRDLGLIARRAFGANDRRGVIDTWIGLHSKLTQVVESEFYKIPYFQQAAKGSIGKDIASIESLIKRKAEKPNPRRKLHE